MSLDDTISQALKQLGDPTNVELGSSTEPPDPTTIEEWQVRLLKRLEHEANVQKKLLLAILLVCLLLFAVGLFLLLYYFDDPSTYHILFGGSTFLAGMLAILRMARNVLIDKASYDILLAVLPVLPPAQVVMALKNLHYTRLNPK